MKENKTLYAFQGLSCILVVFIHCRFPGVWGVFFESLGRIAVPLFFMVSGYSLYYYLGTPGYKQKLRKRIGRIFRITVTALVIYFVLDLLKNVITHDSNAAFLAGLVQPLNIAKFVLLGVMPPSSGGVLWFMMALLYVYCLKYLLPEPSKDSLYRSALTAFLFMLLLNGLKIFFSVYPHSVCGLDLSSSWLYGNWLAIGLPSVVIGTGAARYIEEHKDSFAGKAVPMLWAIALLMLLNFALAYIVDKAPGIYLSYSLFTLAADLLVFALPADTVTRDNSLVLLGKYHCLNVYLWHPVFITVVTVAFGILGLSNSDAAAFAKPVLVAAGAIILSLIIFILGKSFNKKVQA